MDSEQTHGCDTQLWNTLTEFINYCDKKTPIYIAVLDVVCSPQTAA